MGQARNAAGEEEGHAKALDTPPHLAHHTRKHTYSLLLRESCMVRKSKPKEPSMALGHQAWMEGGARHV
jgi:hypothetical protein